MSRLHNSLCGSSWPFFKESILIGFANNVSQERQWFGYGLISNESDSWKCALDYFFLCGTRDFYCFWYLKKFIFHPNYNHSQSGKIWSEEEIFVGYNSDTCGAIILQLCHKGVPQDDVSTQQNIFLYGNLVLC